MLTANQNAVQSQLDRGPKTSRELSEVLGMDIRYVTNTIKTMPQVVKIGREMVNGRPGPGIYAIAPEHRANSVSSMSEITKLMVKWSNAPERSNTEAA